MNLKEPMHPKKVEPKRKWETEEYANPNDLDNKMVVVWQQTIDRDKKSNSLEEKSKKFPHTTQHKEFGNII